MKFALSTLLVCLFLSNATLSSDNETKRPKRSKRALTITMSPWGPSESDVEKAKVRTEKSPDVQAVLSGTRSRLISFRYIENAPDATGKAQPPVRFRAIFYDYTNDIAYIAESDFAGKERISVNRADFDPGVGGDELDAAVAIVKKDPKYAAFDTKGELEIAPAMPPVSNLNGERLVNVSVRNRASRENRIVGVSFKNERVVDYGSSAPPTSRATPEACGIADANQSTTGQGTAGQYQLTVTDGPTTVWSMLVTRPSSSSGSLGSGIDLQNVAYRGKSVLKRAHAPVLNVKYAGNFCGPFIDWQYQEGFLSAPDAGAVDPGPGFRVLGAGQIAVTSLESGNDTGNFRGVAIYTQNNETVLVSEMEAGWYRYIMEWRFGADGTIRPRYGFGATNSSCVCAVHFHHVYWRFDFDVVQPNNKIFQVERGRKFLRPMTTEVAAFRSRQTNRRFMVQNSAGDEAYVLVPGNADGNWNDGDPTFGVGDFWLLKTYPAELDNYSGASINLAPYINGESLNNTDVTIWYGAHFTHSDGNNLLSPNRSPDVLSGSHVVGPDLRPIRW